MNCRQKGGKKNFKKSEIKPEQVAIKERDQKKKKESVREPKNLNMRKTFTEKQKLKKQILHEQSLDVKQ